MQDLTNSLNTTQSNETGIKDSDYIVTSPLSESSKLLKVDDLKNAPESNFFSSLLKDFFVNLKENLGKHTLQYNKKSRYLETLFYKKVLNNSWPTKETSAEFKSLLEIKNVEKGIWLEEINKNEREGVNNQYWLQIRSMRNVSVIEQMVSLYQIYEAHCSSEHEETMSKVLSFAINLTQLLPLKRSPKNIQTIKEIQRAIGQIIFLAERSIDSFKDINEENPKAIFELLDNQFAKHMNSMREALKSHQEAHHKTQLQSSQLAYWNQFCLKVSGLLLTRQGSVNFGIINLILDEFFSSETLVNSAQESILNRLKQIRENPIVRIGIEKITAPENQHIPSTEIIRVALNLSNDEKLTDFHAKKTALTAFLVPHRQISAASCFASSFAIKMKDTHPAYIFKDFHDLLKHGKLTRKVNGVSKDISFLTHIEDNLNREIEVNDKGQVLVNGVPQGYLYQAPGIQSACKTLGIIDIDKAIKRILDQELDYLEDTTVKIRIKSILKKLVGGVYKDKVDNQVFNRTYAQTCFAFSSAVTQPLAKIWENCIAGMAEAAERSMIKSKIISSVIYSFEKELDRLKVAASDEIACFLKTFQDDLRKSVSLKYDPCLGNEENDDEALPTQGGFVLFNNNVRIDEEKYFCIFIREVLAKTYEKLASNKESSELFAYYYKYLSEHTNTDEFVVNLLFKYRSNREKKYFNETQLTPWITQTGNDSKKVMDVYFESQSSIKTYSITPNNSMELAEYLIKVGKELYQDKNTFGANRRMAARIHDTHALTSMLYHPLLHRAIKSKSAPQKWLDKHVLQPGLIIANTKLEKEAQKKIFDKLINTLVPQFLSKKESRKFIENLEKCREDFARLTVKELRVEVLDLFKQFEFLNSLQIAKISHQLDACICNSFEGQLKTDFMKSVLYFCDTNWSKNHWDVHLCLLFNPCSEKLEIWASQANGENFARLRQDEWLINREWEFFVVPDDYNNNNDVIKIYD